MTFWILDGMSVWSDNLQTQKQIYLAISTNIEIRDLSLQFFGPQEKKQTALKIPEYGDLFL